MAIHKDFPKSPYEILDPDIRWFPADEAFNKTKKPGTEPVFICFFISLIYYTKKIWALSPVFVSDNFNTNEKKDLIAFLRQL